MLRSVGGTGKSIARDYYETAHEPRLEILFINYFLVNLGIIVLTLSYYIGNFMIRLFNRILDGS